MNVEQCMTSNPKTCTAQDSLDRAAQIMWEEDCGCVPVVDEMRRLLGIITDRDICMATYTQGQSPWQIRVESAMAKTVYSCNPKDPIESAQKALRAHQLRRLPVIDRDGCVIGILSLTDLVRRSVSNGRPSMPLASDLVLTLSAICQPRKLASAMAEDQASKRASTTQGGDSIPRPAATRSAESQKSSQRPR